MISKSNFRFQIKNTFGKSHLWFKIYLLIVHSNTLNYLYVCDLWMVHIVLTKWMKLKTANVIDKYKITLHLFEAFYEF